MNNTEKLAERLWQGLDWWCGQILEGWDSWGRVTTAQAEWYLALWLLAFVGTWVAALYVVRWVTRRHG